MINLDFSNVPSRAPLDEGVYAVRIVEATETTSSTGNPMLKFTYEVIDDADKHKLWDNFVLIDKCLWKLKELCEAVGIDTSEVCEMEAEEFIGMEFNVKVAQEEYNGSTVNRVKKVLPLA